MKDNNPCKHRIISGTFSLGIILFLGGCGEKEPEYYEVEEIKEPVHEHALATIEEPSEVGQSFHYIVPEGWQEKPVGQMQLLTLEAGKAPQQVADVSVSAFPGDVGGQLANINRWRRQIGLGPMTEEAAQGFIKSVNVSGLPGWQVDFTGPESVVGASTRLIVTVAKHNGQSWFFKIAGPTVAVNDELDRYAAFVQSIQFKK